MNRIIIAVAFAPMFSQIAAGGWKDYQNQNIKIRHAVWGARDASAALRDYCEGMVACSFTVDDGFLGAPPQGEETHLLKVDYACGLRSKHKVAKNAEKVTLTCE